MKAIDFSDQFLISETEIKERLKYETIQSTKRRCFLFLASSLDELYSHLFRVARLNKKLTTSDVARFTVLLCEFKFILKSFCLYRNYPYSNSITRTK